MITSPPSASPYNYILLLALPLLGFLGTCDRAPDADETTDDAPPATAVADREVLYHATFQNLDAAVMDRLLTTDFVAVAGPNDQPRDRPTFLRELAELRQLFPELTIRVDSSQLTEYGGNYIAAGIRTFTWQGAGSVGQYRESFTNNWRSTPEGWRLYRTRTAPYPTSKN